MKKIFQYLFLFFIFTFGVQAWGSVLASHVGYGYDQSPIDATAQDHGYDSLPNFAKIAESKSSFTQQSENKLAFVFSDGFVATRSVKPAISSQKQAGHIPGIPQNANRLKQGNPTSSFFGERTGNHLTQQAFEKGKPVPGRPNVREHDFGVSTGTGPNGGMQSRVRVHQDSKGRIHGHPSGPERF